MKRSNGANAVLLLAGLLLLVGYPFQDTFGGGLIMHTGMAALVGGMADWYAVTALFRKPLGIPWQTEWIPRSQEKIIRMAVHMVTREILSTPNVYRALRQDSPFQQGLAWIESARPSWREHLRAWLVTWPMYVERSWLQATWESARRTGLSHVDAATWLSVMLRACIQPHTAIWKWGVDRLHDVVAATATTTLIADLYRTWQRQEAQRNVVRAGMWEMWESWQEETPETMAKRIQKKLLAQVDMLYDAESDWTKRAQAAGLGMADRMVTDANWRAQIQAWAVPLLEAEWDRYCVEDMWKDICTPDRVEQVANVLVRGIEAEWDRFLLDTERQVSLERSCFAFLAKYLPQIQPALGAAVERELRRYSGAEMAAMVEAEVASDLQIIRINGTVIGGVLGALSYLLLYIWQGGIH